MTERTRLEHVSPFFIVNDLSRAVRFYVEQLGFETRLLAPEDEPFFAIVGRDGVQLLLKDVSDGTEAVTSKPNHAVHPWAPWDAFISVVDPDVLASELASRDVDFHVELADRDDGLRGFEVRDPDGYVLFFGRPS